MPIPTVWRSEYRINTVQFATSEFDVDVAALANGRFAITWVSDDSVANDADARFTIRRANGEAVSTAFDDEVMTANGVVDESRVAVAGLPDGRTVFVWDEEAVGGGEKDVYAEVRNTDGGTFSDRFEITQPSGVATDDQDLPTVLGLSNGNLIVAYRDTQPATDTIRVRPYDIAGVLQGGNTISTTAATDSLLNRPQMTELQNGNVVVTWSGGPLGSAQQKFSIRTPNGLPVLAETDVNPEDVVNEVVAGDVVTLAGGNFVVIFTRPGDANDIQGRRFDQDGNALGGRFDISSGFGTSLAAAALQDGRFMVVYDNTDSIFGRMMFADGTPDGAQFTIASAAGTQSDAAIATLADGRVVVSWRSNELGTNDIFAEIYDPREAGLVAGATSFADDWVGTAFADTVFMAGGNDTFAGGNGGDVVHGEFGLDVLTGEAGNDVLFGGAGNDLMDGGGGADTLLGGAGNDSMFGGNGSDNVDYSGATSGVFAELWRLSAGNDGQGGSDVIVDIENLSGSAFNDTLAGDDKDNLFMGGAGSDAMFGGGGIDTADYSGVASGVFVELWKFFASNDGQGGADTLVDIENITGSAFNDTFAGDNNNNVFKGDAGVDAMFGGSGMDTADYSGASSGVFVELWQFFANNDGQGGVDTLVDIENLTGSAFNDTFAGDNNNNVFKGGAGVDALFGGGGIDTISYADASSGVHVELWQFFASNDGQGGADTLVDMENVTGSAFADVLAGDNNANRLEGAGGTDVLYGGGGADSYAYGAGSGVDYIGDFIKAQGDKIHLQSNLNGSGITTGALALAHTSTIGGNAVVDLGGGNSVTLVGVSTASLAASDFVIF